MARKRKNAHAVALGRKGGAVKSPAKTAAARANAIKRWARRPADPEIHEQILTTVLKRREQSSSGSTRTMNPRSGTT